MISVAVYDTKPYDKQYLEKHREVRWHFHDFRLSASTVATAQGAKCVCVFGNLQHQWPILVHSAAG